MKGTARRHSGTPESSLHRLGEAAVPIACTHPGAAGDEPDSALCYKGPEWDGIHAAQAKVVPRKHRLSSFLRTEAYLFFAQHSG